MADKVNTTDLPFLTAEELQQFKTIVVKKYGVDLTDDEAMDQGTRLVQLAELIIHNKKEQMGIARGSVSGKNE